MGLWAKTDYVAWTSQWKPSSFMTTKYYDYASIKSGNSNDSKIWNQVPKKLGHMQMKKITVYKILLCYGIHIPTYAL